jgi:hypothetical protein
VNLLACDSACVHACMAAGYEPHSALPVAIAMVFCEHSPVVPPAFATVKALATSAVRHCFSIVTTRLSALRG